MSVLFPVAAPFTNIVSPIVQINSILSKMLEYAILP